MLLGGLTSAAALLCAGCSANGASNPAGPDASATPPVLAGTNWRLVEIQSMDDAQGATRPHDPSVYTLSFQPDGRLAMRLNCNRATGGWTATPAADGASGGLAFSQVVMTRAMCTPPSLDGRIARDLGHVRSYRLEKGRLALNLMADGGIYLWEPDNAGPAAP